MSSTAIVIRQLTEQAELNRTHGRLAFAMLLFQDLAFVPLLALATAMAVARAAELQLRRASLQTLAAACSRCWWCCSPGRWLLRPLFYEIAHSRLRSCSR